MTKKSEIVINLEKVLSSCKSANEVIDVWDKRFLPYFYSIREELEEVYRKKREEFNGN